MIAKLDCGWRNGHSTMQIATSRSKMVCIRWPQHQGSRVVIRNVPVHKCQDGGYIMVKNNKGHKSLGNGILRSLRSLLCLFLAIWLERY